MMEFFYRNTFATIPQLITDAKRAMAANAQFSALCLTLALVGNCSQVEWLKTHSSIDRHDKDAYVAWYDMWDEPIKDEIEKERQSTCGTMPRLDGSFLYQIRCAVLHTASIDIDFSSAKKMVDEANRNIINFTFSLSEPNELLICYESYSCYDTGEATATIDIQGLVGKLLHLVEKYYRENESCFKHKGFPVDNFSETYFQEK